MARSQDVLSAVILFACLSFPLTKSAFIAVHAKEAIAAGQSGCMPQEGIRATVSNIDDRLEITLTDGHKLRIAGLEAPAATPEDPDLSSKAHSWLANWLENRDIIYDPLGAKPDRWGRIAANVYVAPGARNESAASAGESLAVAGFARVVPDQLNIPCASRLLLAEKSAREKRKGLWNDPYYAVLSATDGLAFAERAGSVILAEGRVTQVRDSQTRTIVFFGPYRRSNLAVTILQRNVKNFEAAGLHFHDLIGQTLRVRGLLETRFGPEIELTSPGEVELIADTPGEIPLKP